MDIVEIKDGLFIGSAIDDVGRVIGAGIQVVIDLQGGFDKAELAWSLYSYLYCHLLDLPILPNEKLLRRIAGFAYECWKDGQSVLVHCTQGKNRSALIIGMVLNLSGMVGKDAVSLIIEKRPGALFNPVFKWYLQNLP